MQRIFDASDLIEANIVNGLLEQQAIEGYVSGFYLQGGVGELPPAGNTSIWVNDENANRAREIVKEYENGPPRLTPQDFE